MYTKYIEYNSNVSSSFVCIITCSWFTCTEFPASGQLKFGATMDKSIKKLTSLFKHIWSGQRRPMCLFKHMCRGRGETRLAFMEHIHSGQTRLACLFEHIDSYIGLVVRC